MTAVAAVMLLIGGAAPARAKVCVCGPPITPEKAVREVSYVVEGVAVDKWMDLGPDFHHYYTALGSVMPIQTYRFRVARSWESYRGSKGYQGSELQLDQGYTFCDHHFAIGRRYLMFITTHDSPAHAFASSCIRFFEGAEIAAFAATLGTPLASRDVPDTIEVPASRGLRGLLHTDLIASVAVYSWLAASHGTGRAREEWPYSSSGNRAAALWTARGLLLMSVVAFSASVVEIARRRRQQAARFLAAAGLAFALGFFVPGHVLIVTNEWLSDAAFTWKTVPVITPTYQPPGAR